MAMSLTQKKGSLPVGWSSMHYACHEGNLDMVQRLTNKGSLADLRNPTETCGSTPLHFAAEQGHVEVAEYLIRFRADVNAKSKNRKTPMDLALEKDRRKMVQLLDEAGGEASKYDPSIKRRSNGRLSL